MRYTHRIYVSVTSDRVRYNAFPIELCYTYEVTKKIYVKNLRLLLSRTGQVSVLDNNNLKFIRMPAEGLHVTRIIILYSVHRFEPSERSIRTLRQSILHVPSRETELITTPLNSLIPAA